MHAGERASIWHADPPSAWPDTPDMMTVSTLIDIEACPRRWALSAANYPALWSGRGYPTRIHLSGLAGSIVHLALEVLTRELTHAGCASVADAAAVQVLRSLGGYSSVVHNCIDRVLERLNANPRAAGLLEDAKRSLRSQIPRLRTRVQATLGRVHLALRDTRSMHRAASDTRSPLKTGVYPELQLRVNRIGWKGRVDLLLLSEDACEIIDFKSGAQRDDHRFQLQVYALLWALDEEVNPARRLVDKLTLAYEDRDVEVNVPTESELEVFRQVLASRCAAAKQAVETHPPEARPTVDNCRYCSVRQLCDTYWKPETQQSLVAASTEVTSPFGDFEITVMDRHGSTSWDAIIGLSRDLPAGKDAVIRVPDGKFTLRKGQRLRILDAHLACGQESGESSPAIVTLSSLSEVYFIL